MIKSHDTKTILTKDDVKDLNTYFEENRQHLQTFHALYNLRRVRQLKAKLHNPIINKCVNKLINYSEKFLIENNADKNKISKEIKACYFLEYVVNSYAQLHRDNTTQYGTSLITLIDTSEDLMGGDIIIQDVEKPHGVNLHKPNVNKEGYMRRIEVINQSIGETSVYSSNLIHGVSKLNAGSRRVFICWL